MIIGFLDGEVKVYDILADNEENFVERSKIQVHVKKGNQQQQNYDQNQTTKIVDIISAIIQNDSGGGKIGVFIVGDKSGNYSYWRFNN